jgi:uncharacterized membrane protein
MVNLNNSMYDILVVGMISSTILYTCGLVLFLIQTPNPVQTTISHYSSLNEFVQQLLLLRASVILVLATIILISTPIARVFLSVVVFAVNHDHKFVVVTGLVVLILLASMILGYFWNLSIS